MSNAWKITIPVLRAEERDDGKYLIGEASGPERDNHGTEMAPEAIVDFARQIQERVEAGDPLPYIDSHLKTGALRELGWVMEAAITPDFHLKVAVRLDDLNPAASFIHSSALRGKQYGMSIKGDGTEFQMLRDDAGNRFVRFTKVILSEISNTTKPSWVPSFGTVLARSLDIENEEQDMSETLVQDAAPVTETTATEESAPVENAEEQTEQTEETPEVERVEETQETEEAAPVERARIAKKDADALLASYKALGDQLVSLGVLEAPAEETTAPETTTVENSETGEDDADFVEFNGIRVQRDLAEAITGFVTSQVEKATESLTKTLADQQEYITALESLPAGKRPALIVREKFETNEPDLSKMSPEERLRWGLNGVYGSR